MLHAHGSAWGSVPLGLVHAHRRAAHAVGLSYGGFKLVAQSVIVLVAGARGLRHARLRLEIAALC